MSSDAKDVSQEAVLALRHARCDAHKGRASQWRQWRTQRDATDFFLKRREPSEGCNSDYANDDTTFYICIITVQTAQCQDVGQSLECQKWPFWR
jgi:hypothetical protein